jgi:hypothetical protein
VIDVTVQLDPNDKARIDKLLWGLSTAFAGHAVSTGRPRDFRSFLGVRVLPYLQDRMRARFAMEGDDASGQWAALHVRTHWWREMFAATHGLNIQKDHPINFRTGELREFAQTYDLESTATTAELVMPRRLATSVQATKLRHAQRGGTMRRSGTRFPARPVAVLGTRDKTVIDRQLESWVGDLIKELA